MAQKQIFTSPIAIAIYVILTLILIYGITQGWFSGKKIKAKGSAPNPSDCGGQKIGSASFRESGCTKPIFSIANNAEQRCWTYEELGFEPQNGSTVITNEGFFASKKTWYYNYQAGNKYCFTDTKCCNGLSFPLNPSSMQSYINPCGEAFFWNDGQWTRDFSKPNQTGILFHLGQECQQS